jgi:hypothetical protein
MVREVVGVVRPFVAFGVPFAEGVVETTSSVVFVDKVPFGTVSITVADTASHQVPIWRKMER